MLMTAVILIMKESLAPERAVLRWQTILHNYAPCSPIAASWRTAAWPAVLARPACSRTSSVRRACSSNSGVPPQYFGLLFGANALSLIVCSQISARLLRTHPPRLLQRAAR